MTQYDAKFKHMPVLFPPSNMRDGLCEWVSKHALKQYHVAETEKYAHVTFFFNGGIEQAFAGEDRCMVPSPKVPTYDKKPEMNADGVAEATVEGLSKGYDLVMCNFAPPDMVGHTGMLQPAIEAVEATDKAIGKILNGCQKYGYVLVITSDHGNAEQMLDAKGNPHTAHTTNRVPLLIAAPPSFGLKLSNKNGGLCDVAPTCLHIMGLAKPQAMTGNSVLV
jgi:2,3-bisphosphoglycerate-independent phosphoglycerate mutase